MWKLSIRTGLPLVILAFSATSAAAQYPPQGGPFVPYQTPANYQANPYNRVTQPLSPYLNLLRGGIPAVNYYYGVRPALQNSGYGLSAGTAYPSLFPIRPVYLPPTPPGGGREAIQPEFEFSSTPKKTTLSPAGHAVQFANTGGSFPGLAAPRPGGFTKPQKPQIKVP